MSAGMGAMGGAGGAGAVGAVGGVGSGADAGDSSGGAGSSVTINHSTAEQANNPNQQVTKAQNDNDRKVDTQNDLKPVDNINNHSEKLAFTSELFEELEGEGKNPTSIWPPRRT